MEAISLFVRQKVYVIDNANDRRVNGGPGFPGRRGRGRPAFLSDNDNVPFTGVGRIQRETSVFHIFAFRGDLPAKHYPRTFVALVLLRRDNVAKNSSYQHRLLLIYVRIRIYYPNDRAV